MLSEMIIPKKRTRELELDQKQLYAIGLSHAQKLSNRIWTDYNVHDPGITIIELISYALTDLGYRASYPVKDLLSSETDNKANMAKQFFTARQIFPNRPLTQLDYRKILIDLNGIKNAWIAQHQKTLYADTVLGEILQKNPGLDGIEEINVAGLYDVTIEYEEDITTIEQKKILHEKVLERLQANRNLCEDFVDYREVKNQNFNLCADIELDPSANVSAIKAEIFFQVQNYLCPSIHFYSLSEMLGRKKKDGSFYSADEIFDGPALQSGFIEEDELLNAELRTSIRLSDIIRLIMDIKGVQAVREILIMPVNEYPDLMAMPLENKWVVAVEPGKKPMLNIDFLNDSYFNLRFFKRNMEVFGNAEKVRAFLSDLNARSLSGPVTDELNDLEIPLGKFRNPGNYYSFQNDFPAVYGLSDIGVESSSTSKRRALAYQLKGYLLFYDQIMADYFSQLTQIKELFSTDPAVQRTYYYQVVKSFKEYERIYKPSGDDIGAMLGEKTENQLLHGERRNRFLDHLIARFAERFNDFANIVHSAFGAGAESIAGYKCDFLASYPIISSERSLAYNYSLKEISDLWDSNNVSGLERRLAKLLGMPNHQRRNLSDYNFAIYAQVDKTPGNEFRFRIRHNITNKIILSSSTNYLNEGKALDEMRKALNLGMQEAGYQRKKTTDNRFYFNIIDASNEVIARRIEYFASEELMNKAIDELVNYLRVRFSDEGMFLIENLLLLPEETDDPFLPICTAATQTTCADSDPYSYRLHIILPAENGRFANMQFRRFAEEVIREETPAHILPKICWISKVDMAMLEYAYRDWIYLKSGKEKTDSQAKLNSFIKALFAVKNCYPSQPLVECDKSENKFILGQTSIGSI